MISPWPLLFDLIGWMVVFFLSVWLLNVIHNGVRKGLMVARSRRIPPRVGQIWADLWDDTNMPRVDMVQEDRVVLEWRSRGVVASRGYTMAEWRAYVSNRPMYLLEGPRE